MRAVERRSLWLAGVAFLAGLALAALLFTEGSPVAIARPSPLVVEVENVGTHAATAVIAVNHVGGGGVKDWTFPLDANRTASRLLDDPPQGELVVRVTVEWSAALDGGRGEATRIVAPGECASGQPMVAQFRVDTTAGVAFRRSSSVCR